MGGSVEHRQLSGLARSIDALFAPPSPSFAPSPDAARIAALAVDPDPVAVGPEPRVAVESAESSEVADVARAGDELPAMDAEGGSLADGVAAFLAGDSTAAATVARAARGLQERLALDPLADAVERLVSAAGVPPDGRYIDLASQVINPAVASRLVQRLGQQSDEVRREEYFDLCRRMGRVMVNALKGALTGGLDEDVRRTYRRALISMGEVSRSAIEGMVRDENRFLVSAGVLILGEIGGANALELVTSALADTDPRVRKDVLLALGKLKQAKSGPLVLGSLDDPDLTVRVAAAVAAGEIGLERAVRPLVEMLEQEQVPDTYIAVLRALGQLRDPGAVQAIENLAVSSRFRSDPEVRVAAYRALHAIGTPRARELIAQVATDKDPVMRVALRDLIRTD